MWVSNSARGRLEVFEFDKCVELLYGGIIIFIKDRCPLYRMNLNETLFWSRPRAAAWLNQSDGHQYGYETLAARTAPGHRVHVAIARAGGPGR